MAREFADQVAAGNPRRQPESLAIGIGIRDRAAHFEQVRMRIDGYDVIADCAAWPMIHQANGWKVNFGSRAISASRG